MVAFKEFTLFFCLTFTLLSLAEVEAQSVPQESYDVTPTLPFEGVLTLNNKLSSSEKLVQGKLIGPEHLLFHNGAIYTGVLGQGVVKIVGDTVEPVVNFGRPCKLPEEEPICGRVLGLAVDTLVPNSLIIADAYYGIFHYNLDTRRSELLVSPSTLLEGSKGPRVSKIFNAIAVAANGNFYWTSTSSNFNFAEGLYVLLDNPTGRLFRYDRSTRTNRLLVDNLSFANGVVLSPNEDFVLVAQTILGKVIKYHILGSKAGQVETFLDGLPGGPDNIEADTDGIWLAVPLAIDAQNPLISHLLSKNPKAREFFIDLLKITESPYGLLRNEFPESVKTIVKGYVGSFEQAGFAFAPRTTILRVDWNGNIREALYALDGSVLSVSHAVQRDGYLYLGSVANDFIGRYKL